MARILILLPVLALAALIAHAVGAGDFPGPAPGC